jgi:SAM-dependent methyltransferase
MSDAAGSSSLGDNVADHYSTGSIVAAIHGALAEAGLDDGAITAAHIEAIDHLHGGGAKVTRDLARRLPIAAGQHILDIGSGVGGPARLVTGEFDCTVTGIDLTEEYCTVARWLSDLTGFADKTTFDHASATDLPFADGTFDGAICQNVAMNIADKAAFYAGVFRVLKPGAFFTTTDICLGDGGDPAYPVHWAETVETSFLLPVDALTDLIAGGGFTDIQARDTVTEHLAFLDDARHRLKEEGPPLLGPRLVFGERVRDMGRNTARNLEEARVIPVEIICTRA